jgi:hypothetical protein
MASMDESIEQPKRLPFYYRMETIHLSPLLHLVKDKFLVDEVDDDIQHLQ